MSEHIEQTHDDSVVRENDRKIVEGIENHTRPITDQTQSSSIARRYEVELLVGPCLESEAEEFLLAVIEFAKKWRPWSDVPLGVVGSIGPWGEDDADA